MNLAIFDIPYHDDRRQDGETPCLICGKEIKRVRYLVEVINGGCHAAARGLGPDENDAGYLGFLPIGSECRRKMPASFVHDLDKG